MENQGTFSNHLCNCIQVAIQINLASPFPTKFSLEYLSAPQLQAATNIDVVPPTPST
jgi:hypothetical protein